MQIQRNILLVEGTSDFGVIKNLWLKHNRGDPPFEIIVRFGLPSLREAFDGFLISSEVARLGVVVDADQDIGKRWPGFYQTLVRRGYRPIPKAPVAGGLVLHRADVTVPRIGVWVMPDNAESGRLEDFVRYLVRDDDDLWRFAGEVVARLPAELVRFKPKDRLKAHVYTWLAWQKEPGVRLGPAVTRNLLDHGAPPAIELVSWLAKLFVGGPEEESG
jgi:hypothetical protein